MQSGEVTKMLGINRARIKYFKKQEVFIPEKAATDSKNIEYTERDVATLRKLVVLTKSGLTCGDIKKVQDDEWTLRDASINRGRLMDAEIKRMRCSLLLLKELSVNDAQYDSMSTDYFWDMIQQKEKDGEEFMDVDDMCDYRPVSLIRTIRCPHCSAEHEIDFGDYLWDETSNESRFSEGMGPDVVYSFDTEDNYTCEETGKVLRVDGWIREYPIGGYDSEHIEIR